MCLFVHSFVFMYLFSNKHLLVSVLCQVLLSIQHMLSHLVLTIIPSVYPLLAVPLSSINNNRSSGKLHWLPYCYCEKLAVLLILTPIYTQRKRRFEGIK